jgi:hypothetical protein
MRTWLSNSLSNSCFVRPARVSRIHNARKLRIVISIPAAIPILIACLHHSTRNASVGLIEAARRAGIQQAAKAMAVKTKGARTKVNASCG